MGETDRIIEIADEIVEDGIDSAIAKYGEWVGRDTAGPTKIGLVLGDRSTNRIWMCSSERSVGAHRLHAYQMEAHCIKQMTALLIRGIAHLFQEIPARSNP